ncbi:hypothetical protein V6R21_19080 [Limibacter armeniacum]|uniref:hypothetical protein n=1 Tax=Limibacter armeniacum TaxID=466084 RepID=UPI002FE5F1BB
MGKLFTILKAVLQYAWIIDLVTYLVKSGKNLLEHKEPLKAAADKVKEIFGALELTPQNIPKVVETLELTAEAGGVDELHEFLTEAKAAGILDKLRDIIEPGVKADV